MVKVEPTQRITIEQVIESSFFDPIRSLSKCPVYKPEIVKLKKICEDFIQRGNVHKFSGREEFDRNWEALKDTAMEVKYTHIYRHALFFIFDIDPQSEKIEKIKKEVQESSKAAREKNKLESSDSESEEPEEPFNSMGCKFNPEEFKDM
jgi:hypothetical protein